MTTVAKEFNVLKELENTVLQNLVQSFGIDFILLEDKRGGDVDTVHNVRVWQKEAQGGTTTEEINISDDFRSKMTADGRNKEEYQKIQHDSNGNIKTDAKGKPIKSDDYHNKSTEYVNRKAEDRKKEEGGALNDGYIEKPINTNSKKENSKYSSELDHVVSASETHHDSGRILAGIDGVALANSDTNLVSTHWYFNNIKNNHDLDSLFKDVLPKRIEKK